ATLTLGDNRRVDLSQCVIILTSNLGGGEITELMTGGMGFAQPTDKREERLDEKVERTAAAAAKKKFSPEFMNRLDKVVVFHPLRPAELGRILEIELGMVQQRVLETARGQFLFRVTPGAREFLLRDGTDLKYGARHLKRAIERHVVYPLANLLATEQVRFGDILRIDGDVEGASLSFSREAEDAPIPRFPRHRNVSAARVAQSRRPDQRVEPRPELHPEQRNDPRPEPRTYAELPEPALSR
ncbi:MAG: AAA family ATPase, partial [Candidatus Acidiferrales bacterium]